MKTIQNIAQSDFPPTLIQRLSHQIQYKHNDEVHTKRKLFNTQRQISLMLFRDTIVHNFATHTTAMYSLGLQSGSIS